MEDEQKKQFNFSDTTATQKVFDLTKRIRAVAGGTSASKTISILVWIIDYCQTPQEREKLATVTAESVPHLKQGAALDFENIMKDRGYWIDGRWNKSDRVYSFETGNKVQFSSFDTYGKAHGGRRDVLFVNEANNNPYNIVDQLITRTREVVFLDWNPSNEFWFYQEMLGKREDVDFITLTYKDNEALDHATIQEIESHKHNKQWWQVYGLGQLGQLESQIYKNWQTIDDVPTEAKLERRGLDFGYSVDPTVIEALYTWNGAYVFDEELYMKGLSNKTIADHILSQPEQCLVIADSSEPKSIDEIAEYGVQIVGAQKGAGSVYQGIQYLQDKKVFVTKRSVKTIKAQRNYIFFTDKDGKVTNDPDDAIHEWSNPMDACRYAADSFNKTTTFKMPTDVGGIKPLLPGTLA
jgi:phage terminase large subunit